MSHCETCGNQYDHSFLVVMNGKEHEFDCFECAVEALAPRCRHCECRIIGHGMENDGHYFCSAHCARESGIRGLVDHL